MTSTTALILDWTIIVLQCAVLVTIERARRASNRAADADFARRRAAVLGDPLGPAALAAVAESVARGAGGKDD